MKPPFPKIMGVMNITPDSFSDGSDYNDLSRSLKRAEKLIDDGADILDIGGESSRPGANPVSTQEELTRVIPLIKSLKKEFPDVYISVDTMKYEVAKQACDFGAKMINDISGLTNDIRLIDIAKKYQADLCIMHMKGNPKTMQKNPIYSNLIVDIQSFLSNQTKLAKEKVNSNIYVDPGIGFGKTQDHNIEILKNLEKFNKIGDGILLGISRKSFIGKYFQIDNPKDRDLPTTLIHSILLSKPVDIIRVHNVEQLNTLKNAYKMLN